MSIKPVDFQVMIPRTIDAAKVRSDEMQKNNALIQQQAKAVNDDAEDTLKQVYSKSQVHETRISEKQKENSQQNEKKKKEDKDNDKSNEAEGTKSQNQIRTSTIDIKI